MTPNATARLLQDLADNAKMNRAAVRYMMIISAGFAIVEAATNGFTWTWLGYITFAVVFSHWWSEQTRLVNRCKTEGLHQR